MPTDLSDITSLLQQFGADEGEEKKPSVFSRILNGLAMGDDKYASDMRAKDREKLSNKAALRRLIINDALTGNREEAGDTRRFGHEDTVQGRTLDWDKERLDKTLTAEEARQLRSLKAASEENRMDRDAVLARDRANNRDHLRNTLRSIEATTKSMDARQRQAFQTRLEQAHTLDPINGIQSVIDEEIRLPRAKTGAAIAEQEWLKKNPYANTRVGQRMIEDNIDPSTMQRRDPADKKGKPVANFKTLLSTPAISPSPTNSPAATSNVNEEVMKRLRSVGPVPSMFSTGNFPPSKYD